MLPDLQFDPAAERPPPSGHAGRDFLIYIDASKAGSVPKLLAGDLRDTAQAREVSFFKYRRSAADIQLEQNGEGFAAGQRHCLFAGTDGPFQVVGAAGGHAALGLFEIADGIDRVTACGAGSLA